jgi:hypothetical protein
MSKTPSTTRREKLINLVENSAQAQTDDIELTEGLENTFPASDPISITQPRPSRV